MNDLHPSIARILEGRATWEPLGYRVLDYDAIRREVPRQLLELAREDKARSGSRAMESHSSQPPPPSEFGAECARVLRALCASLLIIPARAPARCPVLNVQDISIPDAISSFRKGLADRLGPPILHAPTYPNWELAVSCYALALEAEYRGPLYLGTTRSPNERDLALGVWNFNVDLTNLIDNWGDYVRFCKENDWYRDRVLGLTPPGLVE